ncbi:hypothetical protein D3C73_1578940 [compost metagenome]
MSKILADSFSYIQKLKHRRIYLRGIGTILVILADTVRKLNYPFQHSFLLWLDAAHILDDRFIR